MQIVDNRVQRQHEVIHYHYCACGVCCHSLVNLNITWLY
jgi:hypothetical protein